MKMKRTVTKQMTRKIKTEKQERKQACMWFGPFWSRDRDMKFPSFSILYGFYGCYSQHFSVDSHPED